MKSIQQLTIIIILSYLVMPFQAISQCDGNNTFTGTINSDWHTPSNWSEHCVPVSPVTGQITIAANCSMSSGTYTISGTFQIDEGVTFTNTSSGEFTVSGNITGEGLYIGDLIIDGDIKPGDIPSPTPPVITCGELLYYGGQYYSTVQIGGQCWMAENLNIGTVLNSIWNMTNNNVIEKYCYNNSEANCAIHGGLYQWNEAMQYSTIESTQGICPIGWHLPSDGEIKTMEMALGMSQAQADLLGWRGTNEGSKLAGNEPLWTNGLLDQNPEFGSSGFEALPTGYLYFGYHPPYHAHYIVTFFWSSNELNGLAYYRRISNTTSAINRQTIQKSFGYSIRCVQD